MKNEVPRLFPFPLVEGNVEGLTARHSRSSIAIYLTVVIGLLLSAASLPLINVEVNSRSRGVLRPQMKLAPVVSSVSGRVTLANLRENGAVCAGDTLLKISTAELDTEVGHLNKRLAELRLLTLDLQSLSGSAVQAFTPDLRSEVYQRDYRDHRRRQAELLLKLDYSRRQRTRQEQLMTTGSVARMELEQSAYEVELLEGQVSQLAGQQQHSWTEDLQRVDRESGELRQQLGQLAERSKQYVVTAPIDGHLARTDGIQPGAFASAGQVIAHVSPEGDLRVEAYVSPGDIGLLREGLPVRLQLDAFNYNQWGLARATLTEIGTDVTEVDGTAAFLVTCTLHDKNLKLKNGYVGTLRKGMTLTAHFTLNRRTLFELLHDQLDDWFNPIYS